MDEAIKPIPPAPVVEHARLTATIKAQHLAALIEPIHAEKGPVQAYAEHITKVTGKPHSVVHIPDNSTAYAMGYRYMSVPDTELDYYLAHGAARVSP